MKIIKLVFLSVVVISQTASAQIISQWRGLNRDGIYTETNLLKVWPSEGPELICYNDSLPKGYSSVAVDDNKIYLTGIKDSMDYLIALNSKCEFLWEKPIGKAWMNSFSDSRSTPTIDGDYIYVSSGDLGIACVHKISGEIVWKVNVKEKYSGKCGEWGYSESLLVIDDKVFATPAGDKTTMVAFNKKTGEEIWQSKSLNDFTGYASPIHVYENGTNMVITVLASYVVGFNADNGEVLFKSDYSAIGNKNSVKVWDEAPKVNTNSPIYFNKEIYLTSGYNHSGVKFRLSDDLKQITTVWVDSVLDVHHGATVLLNGYIYGANWINNRQGNWCCINWETGNAMYEKEWQTKGSIIYADSMLYCYDEKRGNIALVKPNSLDFNIVSEFQVTKGKGPHWSHLVIYNGKLYVRHENAVMVYNIKEK